MNIGSTKHNGIVAEEEDSMIEERKKVIPDDIPIIWVNIP